MGYGVNPILKIFTVTLGTRDYPNRVALRAHVIYPGRSEPENIVFLFRTLHAVRRWCLWMGLTRLERDPSDDPVIVESWI